MNHAVNFLPWRQRRRQACLRFWGGMFAAVTTVALAILLSGVAARSVNARVTAVRLMAENELSAAFAAARPRFQQRQARVEQVRQQALRRQQTRRWQPALEELAQSLPDHSWLSRMDFQQDTLELSGKALSVAALGLLEKALRDSRRFRISATGATRQDAQGHWQFQYRLVWRENHAPSL